VSGDYFDYAVRPDGKIYFVIADVSGKGIAAALVMAGVATAFDAQAASQAMRASLVSIDLDLGLGSGQATALGCDMTPEYVTFNADYTT